MPSIVVTGAQWGDEGKGKIVDALAEAADVVVRFQGGNNAGHTLVVDGVKTKLQLTPCGMLHPHTTCIIAAGVVANPRVLIREFEQLSARGISVTPARLIIDRDCHLVLDYHPLLDNAREATLGNAKIGTTGLGIGPAYEDRVGRRGVRFGDLFDLNSLRPRIEALVEEKNLILQHVLKSSERVTYAQVNETITLAAEKLLPFVGNGGLFIDRALRDGRRVVFEGAQAALLDVTFGTVPFVTSSSTIAGAALTGCGVGPNRIDHVMGVTKAYTTRVGSGPFPTELLDKVGDLIRERGGEFGTVTGRPRRCGWLDMVALRRAIRLNGCSSLALMKMDVLTGINPIRICTHYELDGKIIDDFPPLLSDLGKVSARYLDCAGWEESITHVRRLSDLPQNARTFLEQVENLAGCPLSLVSVSPERNATIPYSSDRFVRQFAHFGYVGDAPNDSATATISETSSPIAG